MVKSRGVTKYRHFVQSALLRDHQLLFVCVFSKAFRQFREWQQVSYYQFYIFSIIYFFAIDCRHSTCITLNTDISFLVSENWLAHAVFTRSAGRSKHMKRTWTCETSLEITVIAHCHYGHRTSTIDWHNGHRWHFFVFRLSHRNQVLCKKISLVLL